MTSNGNSTVASGSSLERIAADRVVPVVVIDDPDTALPLAQALVKGGLRVAEVTFRTPDAAMALTRMTEQADLCVGAGTVLNAGQVDAAVDAGAHFVVSPGLSAAVVQRCREHEVAVIPGVATASEVTEALALGVDVAKLFPVAQLGGPSVVAALTGPFPQMRFIPTGGITADNAPDYLQHGSVVAVGGSWMVPTALVRQREFDRITELTREAVSMIQQEDLDD